MNRLSRPLADLKPAYDVVVVGSGYGGGVAASRLARAGLKVAVIERGREIRTGEFPARFPDLARELQVTGARMKTGSETGLYDFRIGEDMHVLVACGLGGGSLVNAGVALVPDARVFEDAVWPEELRRDGLLTGAYETASTWLRPARHKDAAALSKFKALSKAASAHGVGPVAAPVVVSFEANRNAAGIEQPACTLCGDCCAGCNVGAKNTVALTYLPDAAHHGAELFSQARASHIEREGDGWRVVVVPVGAERKADASERTVTAHTVILAAGTLGSSEVLLRSAACGLALSDRLGERFSGNGDIIAFGYGATDRVNAIGIGHPPRFEGDTVGACVSGQIEIVGRDRLEDGLTIQEGVMPSALAPMLPMLFVPGGRLLGALESLVKGVYKGPFAHLQTFFAVSHDSARGRLRLVEDRLALNWPGVGEEECFPRLDAALASTVGAVGGSYIKNPLAKTSVGAKPATAHPLGGAAMGADCGAGVVNHKGQVFDPSHGKAAVHRGLYVLDGSIIPRSLGVNPLLTITALAERAMQLYARDHNLSISHGPIASNAYAAAVAPAGAR